MTTYQALQNGVNFRAYGDGFFGLANRHYSVTPALRNWILTQLSQAEPLTWDELEQRALQAQFVPADVRGALSVMPEVKFHRAVPRRGAWVEKVAP